MEVHNREDAKWLKTATFKQSSILHSGKRSLLIIHPVEAFSSQVYKELKNVYQKIEQLKMEYR